MQAAAATEGRVELVDVPVPTPRSGQVLIEVRAAGLNAADHGRSHRAGAGVILGGEAAGVVVAAGADADHHLVGLRVAAFCRGAFSEYVVAWADQLIAVPEWMSWADAAAFAVPFVTAHDAIKTAGRLRRGQTVMVNASTSTVGVAALQIAKPLGAGKVVAVSRTMAGLEQLKSVGVEFDVGVVSDSKDEQSGVVGDASVDVVVDMVGGPTMQSSIDALALGGRLVSVGRLGGTNALVNLDELSRKRLSVIGVTFRTRTHQQTAAVVRAAVKDLAPLWERGALTMPVDQSIPIRAIDQAMRYHRDQRRFGKVVITMPKEERNMPTSREESQR